jgi:hypothetical protein
VYVQSCCIFLKIRFISSPAGAFSAGPTWTRATLARQASLESACFLAAAATESGGRSRESAPFLQERHQLESVLVTAPPGAGPAEVCCVVCIPSLSLHPSHVGQVTLHVDGQSSCRYGTVTGVTVLRLHFRQSCKLAGKTQTKSHTRKLA